MLFLLYLILAVLFIMWISSLSDRVAKPTDPKFKCPPHAWVEVNDVKMTNGSLYSGLRCTKCGRIPLE